MLIRLCLGADESLECCDEIDARLPGKRTHVGHETEWNSRKLRAVDLRCHEHGVACRMARWPAKRDLREVTHRARQWTELNKLASARQSNPVGAPLAAMLDAFPSRDVTTATAFQPSTTSLRESGGYDLHVGWDECDDPLPVWNTASVNVTPGRRHTRQSNG